MKKSIFITLMLIFLNCSIYAMGAKSSNQTISTSEQQSLSSDTKIQELSKDITAEVITDKKSYIAGAPIIMSLTVKNTGTEEVEFYFPSSQKYDFIIENDKGKEAWRWSHGKMFLMAVYPGKISLHQTMSFRYIWDQKDNSGKQVPSGVYYITGKLSSIPAKFSSAKKLTIQNKH